MIFDIENELLNNQNEENVTRYYHKLFHTVILLTLLKPGFAGLQLDRSKFLLSQNNFCAKEKLPQKKAIKVFQAFSRNSINDNF